LPIGRDCDDSFDFVFAFRNHGSYRCILGADRTWGRAFYFNVYAAEYLVIFGSQGRADSRRLGFSFSDHVSRFFNKFEILFRQIFKLHKHQNEIEPNELSIETN
jgi:hypothetical protein